MATRRRHHYIPRLLLNRFASRQDGKKYWIWQLSQEREPLEISTKDVAVSSGFYGKDDTSLEDAFALEEGSFGSVLRRLEVGVVSEELHDDLRWMLWTLGARTRSFREGFIDVGGRIVDKAIATANSEEAKASFTAHTMKQAKESYLRAARKKFAHLPPHKRVEAERALQSPASKRFLQTFVETQIASMDTRAFIEGLVDRAELDRVLKDAGEKGQIEGLSNLLDRKSAPDSFRPLRWEVIDTYPVRLVLGDTCALALSKAGQPCSLLRFDKSRVEVYLPIGEHRLLVGLPDGTQPQLSPLALNRASAELASSFLFSSQREIEPDGLVALIGQGDALASDEDLESVDEQTIWKNRPK